MTENESAFKNWINATVVNKYANGVNSKQRNEFKKISNQLDTLELRARVKLIANTLKVYLDQDFPKALNQLMKIVKDQELKSFELWPATEFIQIYGLDHIDESLQAMYELTPKFTAEFSIRPFINIHGDIVFDKLKKWHNDSNEHIRRWLSEGTRPRLPWGERLTASVKNPKLGLIILDKLKFDSSLYVRKSVANHLNDIAKDHPELVIKTLAVWSKHVPKHYQKEFNFILHRALRTLIKDGHTEALKLIGIKPSISGLKVENFNVKTKTIKMGSNLEFSFDLKNTGSKKQKYIVDFIIYFQKSNGSLSSKVFKLKSGFIDPQSKIQIYKKYSFRAITTRKYYPGLHKISLKLNGTQGKTLSFDLL
jgi:3-methyladenine DNA glycosylase AlkC